MGRGVSINQAARELKGIRAPVALGAVQTGRDTT